MIFLAVNTKRTHLLLLSLLLATRLSGEVIEEHVEVTERIFSRELASKNMVIISAEKIEALKIGSLSELFSYFTSLNVSRRGSDESSYDLSMRGCHFEQVLILLDGIPLNNPQTGHFNTDFPFSIHDIERVEIIRGGSSTTYGSGAFAGVVNFILKQRNAVAATLSGGSDGYFSGGISLGQTWKTTHYSLSANRGNSRGFHPGREYDRWQVQGSASLTLARNRLELLAGYLDKDFGAAGFYGDSPSWESSQGAFLSFQFHRNEGHRRYLLGYSQQEHWDEFIQDRNRPNYFRNQSRTLGRSLHASFSFDWRPLQLAAGGELKQETMESTAMGDHRRDHSALYLNGSYVAENDRLDLGLRSEQFAGRNLFIFNTGYSRRLSPLLSASLNVGRTMRLPTFTEQYYFSPTNSGDPRLQPETSLNCEASLIWFGPARVADLSLFYRRQSDTIDWIRRQGSEPWQAVNLRKNDLLGSELTLQTQRGKTQFLAAIEKIWVLNEQSGFQSKYGLRFPDFSVKANLTWEGFRNITFTGNYLYKHLFRTSEKGHFLNAIVGYRFRQWRFSLRCENLFNTIIEEIPGIRIDGRRYIAGIAFH